MNSTLPPSEKRRLVYKESFNRKFEEFGVYGKTDANMVARSWSVSSAGYGFLGLHSRIVKKVDGYHVQLGGIRLDHLKKLGLNYQK